MSDAATGNNTFIGYEYNDVTVRHDMVSIYTDGCANFGWTLEGTSYPIQKIGSVTLKLKRDRKIRNKAEVTRLSRQFDSCISEIMSLENSKVIPAAITAYIIGIAGTTFIAGSVFAYLGSMAALMVILAIPGFIGWVIPYFCYARILNKRTKKVTPLIDEKYDEIYNICEKASSLLS